MVIDKNVSADISATRGTVDPKIVNESQHKTPIFCTNVTKPKGGQRLVKKIVLLILVNRAIKPPGKIFRTQKKKKNFFLLLEDTLC